VWLIPAGLLPAKTCSPSPMKNASKPSLCSSPKRPEKSTKRANGSASWTILTTSLHDDVYRKVNHVARGHIKSLLDEVAHALVVNNLEEVQPLRLELYGATMQKDCANDLQLWINFIVERGNKLDFLKKTIPQEELVAIFLKGLHPVFNQLQVYFSIPGQLPNTFEKAVTTVRKFATTPLVAAELAKLKTSGMSQNMFPLIPQSQSLQTGKSIPSFAECSQTPAPANTAPGANSSIPQLLLQAMLLLRNLQTINRNATSSASSASAMVMLRTAATSSSV
jgi:hypothetical protein